MFKYDGIYQRESFDEEYATLLLEMGRVDLFDQILMEMVFQAFLRQT